MNDYPHLRRGYMIHNRIAINIVNDESLRVHPSKQIEVAELRWNGASELIPVQVSIKKNIIDEC